MEIKWFVLALAILMYLLVICFQNKKVWFSSLAAVIVIVLALFLPGKIFYLEPSNSISPFFATIYHIFAELINWNVLMIYVGSMAIAALFIYSKVPACIADWIVKISPSTGLAIVLILAMTGIISIFVENVATVFGYGTNCFSNVQKNKNKPNLFYDWPCGYV